MMAVVLSFALLATCGALSSSLETLPSAAPRRTVAVTGATGKLGRRAVEALVESGAAVRALVRHDADGAAVASDGAEASGAEVARWLRELSPRVALVRGDVTDEAAARELCVGCDAVLALHGATRRRKVSDLWRDATLDPSHAARVNRDAVSGLVAAAKAAGCDRVVRVTGKGETPWSIFSILINLLGSSAKAYNYEGERVLRGQTDVDYTIVRPGVMAPGATLKPRSLALADDGGDLKVSAIPHGAIADLCVKCLDHDNAARATLCAMTVDEGDGADSYDALLPGVRPDRRAFRDDLLQEHLLAVRVGGAALAAAAATLAYAAAAAARAVLHIAAGLLR